MLKFLRRLFLAVLILGLLGAGALGFILLRPYAGFEQPAFVDIPKGTSAFDLADMLQRAGVVRQSWAFLLARALHPHTTLQAGEYRFHQPATALEVFNRIARGDIFYYELVVPEGNNMFDIAAAIDQLGLFSRASFLQAVRDPRPVVDIAPAAPSLEGYLYPDTYRITRQTTAQQLCAMMVARFRKGWRQLESNASVHPTVTLASLVEKESAAPEERPLIASVFWNRLNQGMRLDCDPTTVYAALIENRYRGTIHRSDLDSRNPYNTYQHTGLPPGPIANPSLESIKAVLQPAQTKYLFFVAKADGSGRHHFSESMAQHSVAALEYRRAQGLKEAAPPAVSGRK